MTYLASLWTWTLGRRLDRLFLAKESPTELLIEFPKHIFFGLLYLLSVEGEDMKEL